MADLHVIVAGDAFKRQQPFPLRCNCGGIVPLSASSSEELKCPKCGLTLRAIVVEGDPGYIIGSDDKGEPTLLPVQGSAAPHPASLSADERARILADVKTKMKNRGGPASGT